MALSGFLGAIVYSFLIGLVWHDRSECDLPSFIVSLALKSLWISWLVVVFSLITGAGNLLIPIALILIVASIWHDRNHNTHKLEINWLQLALIAGVFALSLKIFSYSFWGFYIPVFDVGDGIVSWNRWAAELSENRYFPVDAAYPVLFPGIWSLIYKAQGSHSLWMFAEFSLWIIPLILCASVMMIMRANLLAGAAAAVFVLYFFFELLGRNMFNGAMDAPVAAMMFTAALAMILSANASDQDERQELYEGRLLQAALAVGLASTVKQAGAMLIPVFLIWLVLLYWQEKVEGRRTLFMILITLLPGALFMLIFLMNEFHPLGHFEYLRGLADSSSGDDSKLANSFSLLLDACGPVLLSVLALCAISNLFRLQTSVARLGLALLISAIAGFLLFADCCSYSVRNGWWVVALLAASAIAGVMAISGNAIRIGAAMAIPVRLTQVHMVLAAATLAATASVGLTLPDDRLAEIQANSEIRFMPQAALIRRNFQRLKNTGLVLSRDQRLGFVSGTAGRHAFTFNLTHFVGKGPVGFFDACGTHDHPAPYSDEAVRTLAEILECRPGSLLLVGSPQDLSLLRKAHPAILFKQIDADKNWMLLEAQLSAG